MIEVGNVSFLVFLGPNELSVIETCPYYRGVHKERLAVMSNGKLMTSHVWEKPNESGCTLTILGSSFRCFDPLYCQRFFFAHLVLFQFADLFVYF